MCVCTIYYIHKVLEIVKWVSLCPLRNFQLTTTARCIYIYFMRRNSSNTLYSHIQQQQLLLYGHYIIGPGLIMRTYTYI